MSNSFSKNHSVKKITRRCFAVIVACFMAQAAFLLHAETPRSTFQDPYFGENRRHGWLNLSVPYTRYEQALKEETPNGLIALDFRALKRPSFSILWFSNIIWGQSWDYSDYFEKASPDRFRGYYKFSSETSILYDDFNVYAHVSKNYELAQALFLTEISSYTDAGEQFWVECKKKIGTFCLSSRENDFIFFFYKNVTITIKSDSSIFLPELFAQWLYEVLKGFPLNPMNAPLQFRREPYSAPIFEYLGSEVPAGIPLPKVGEGEAGNIPLSVGVP
jgi:hypothetical protein